MALFGKKSKSKSSDALIISQEDEVLGFIDELFRKRVPISFNLKTTEASSEILFIDHKNKLLRIQMSALPRMPHGTDLVAGFSLDRTWWAFRTKLAVVDDKPFILIPKAIQYAERRRSLRTSFNPREQVKVTILQGLGSGNGVFGMATDISADGLAMTIEKAMSLANEKEIPPSPTLFPPNASLDFIKINRLPGCPLIELQGIAKRTYKDGKWYVAVEFRKVSKTTQVTMNRFIEPRLLDFKPTRRSFKEREEREAELRRSDESSLGGAAGSAASGTAASGAAAPTATPSAASSAAASGSAPTAVAAALGGPTSSATPESEKRKILIVGDGLPEALDFMVNGETPFQVLVGSTPVSIVKLLSEENPCLLVCGVELKNRSILHVLEKIRNMGVLKDQKTVMCAEDIQAKDRIKLKMMQIHEVIPLPVEDQAAFINHIQELLPPLED